MRSLTVTEALCGAAAIGVIAFFLGTGSSPYSLEGLTALVVGIAWPIVILISVWVFKKPVTVMLHNFAHRITDLEKAGKDGFQFRPQTTGVANKSGEDSLKFQPQETPTGPGAEAILKRDQNIRQTLVDAGRPVDATSDLVIRALSISSLENTSLWVTTAIFRSQVDLLMSLNDDADWIDQSAAMKFYYEGLLRGSAYGTEFEFLTWMEFLTNNDLIEQQDNQCRITAMGKYYVQFLKEKNLNWKNLKG